MSPVTCKEKASSNFPLRHGVIPPGSAFCPPPPRGMHWDLWFPSLWLASDLALLSEAFALLLSPGMNHGTPGVLGPSLDFTLEPTQIQEHWGQVGHASLGPPSQIPGGLQHGGFCSPDASLRQLCWVWPPITLLCPGPETQVPMW